MSWLYSFRGISFVARAWLEHIVEAPRLGNRDVAAETRQTVVAAALIRRSPGRDCRAVLR